jgi:hypothetical protein
MQEKLFDFLEANIDTHGLSSAPLLLKQCEVRLEIKPFPSYMS